MLLIACAGTAGVLLHLDAGRGLCERGHLDALLGEIPEHLDQLVG
jgi:hypothetical protein